MADASDKLRCTLGCWAMGGLAGVLGAVMLVLLGELSWPGAIFSGLILFVLVGVVLSILLCRPLPTLAEMQARHAAEGVGKPMPRAAAPAAAAPAAAAPVAAPAAPAPAPAPAPSPAPAAVADLPPVAPDGKPQLLTEARAGGPDDLKQIKGVGPKMEEMLHKMGIYHFDQVASWRAPEVAWVDENLEGFKGRVSRDNWVEQAKILAAGGETEFSKKVEDGGVY